MPRHSTCPGSPRTSSSGRFRSRRPSNCSTRGTRPRSSPATARSGPAGWTSPGCASSATASPICATCNERKQTILKTIDAQGKLTDDLRKAILTAETHKRVEDLYLPFKPKKRTPAADAREKGLGELAAALWNRDPAVATWNEVLAGMVNPEKGLDAPEDVLAGTKLILTEMIAEMADVRAPVRSRYGSRADHVAEGRTEAGAQAGERCPPRRRPRNRPHPRRRPRTRSGTPG